MGTEDQGATTQLQTRSTKTDTMTSTTQQIRRARPSTLNTCRRGTTSRVPTSPLSVLRELTSNRLEQLDLVAEALDPQLVAIKEHKILRQRHYHLHQMNQ